MRSTLRRPSLVVSVLTLALLGALSMPAWAADPACVDANGNPVAPAPSTDQGNEHGTDNTTCSLGSSAYGLLNNASGQLAQAFGRSNTASGLSSNAFGGSNYASGEDSSAFGSINRATGKYSSAVGYRNGASGSFSSAFGGFFDNGDGVLGAGDQSNNASGYNSAAFGNGNLASGTKSSAFGVHNTAQGFNASAFGYASQALNPYSTAIGYQAVADRDYAISVGQTGAEHQIIHLAAGTEDTDAVNLGQLNAAIAGVDGFGGFSISANGNVAEVIGDGETVDFAANDPNGNLTVTRSGNTITYGFANAPTFAGLTVGGAGASFTIVNNTIVNMGNNVVGGVANGVAATDAVNKGQLDAGLATANGNAAAAQTTANSAMTAAGAAQTTANQAVSDAAAAQTTANTALSAANAAQATANTAVTKADAAQATANTAVIKADAAQATANTAVTKADAAQATANTAVTKADAAQVTANTALAAAGNAITVANDYTDTRETAIRTDMAAGDAATLVSSMTYTDTKSAQTLASANAYTDSKLAAWNDSFTQYQQQVDVRFAKTDARIDRNGAMSGAMASAAINTAGLPGQNRVGLGVGMQNGRSAVAVGYQRLLRPNVSVSLTGAFSGGDSAISAGTGFSW